MAVTELNVTKYYLSEVKEKQVSTAKSYPVTKANHLIRHSRSSLSAFQSKVIAYAISKIVPGETDLTEFSFSISDFCDICGIRSDGMYSYVKKSLQQLRDTSVWVAEMNEQGTKEIGGQTLSWVDKVIIKNGQCTLKLSVDLREFLLDLKQNFTTYSLGEVVHFKSKYTSWFYDNIASFAKLHSWQISVEEIKEKLGVKYEYKFLRTRVIETALKEINEYTSFDVQYIAITSGKRVTDIQFLIKMKPLEERLLLDR